MKHHTETSPADRLTLRPPSWRRGSPWDLELVQGMAVTGLTWEEAEKLHRLLGEALAERNAQ